jgi:hypothetical protein
MPRTIFYHRFMYFFILFVFANNISFSQQCQAVTKKGTLCKRNAQSGSIYCSQHRAMYESMDSNTASGTNSATPTSTVGKQQQKSHSDDSSSVRCHGRTKNGNQCSRRAKAGSQYCWQHGGEEK